MTADQQKKTLVLGASGNPERYSFLAVNRLRAHGHPVLAIGKKKVTVGDVVIGTDKTAFSGVDTVTLYLNAGNQAAYYDYILSLHPRRLIFNPRRGKPGTGKPGPGSGHPADRGLHPGIAQHRTILSNKTISAPRFCEYRLFR